VLAAVVVGCQTTKVVNFPPPDEPCATEADLDRLDEWIPAPVDIQTALDIDDTMGRVMYSVSYCQEGEERLR
jgi:hypothetical protein